MCSKLSDMYILGYVCTVCMHVLFVSKPYIHIYLCMYMYTNLTVGRINKSMCSSH